MGPTGTGSPCGACKFLRRKCAPDCVFAPYFSNEQGPAQFAAIHKGPAQFAAIHKVYGASNAAKLLSHVPQPDRREAVLTIAYEAQARLCDPVYGCVSHIFALQQQVASLQTQLMQTKAQIAREAASVISMTNANAYDPPMPASYVYGQSSATERVPVPEVVCVDDGEELRALALRMMGN